jgi:hypothetical protein
MLLKIKIDIPYHLLSFANISMHWTKKAKLAKTQKNLISLYLLEYKRMLENRRSYNIILTRIAPRNLDYDNLVSAFKHIRDAICEFIFPDLAPGRADNLDVFQFDYQQDKGKSAIRIELMIES